jgi:hypothetical protein
MLFAGLLGARQRVPTWQVGRAATWMRGHLWLGALSLPLILFHAGFQMGGPLTRVLMWLLFITVASGFLGAAIQHFLPRVYSLQAPMETIFDQIDSVRRQLLAEADQVVEHVCGELNLAEAAESDEAAPAGLRAAGLAPARAMSVMATQIRSLASMQQEQTAPLLRNFYLQDLRPALADTGGIDWWRDDSRLSRSAFQNLRTVLPPAGQQSAEYLENLYAEHQQLGRQQLIHRLLHAWLLVHVPLSYAVLLLGAVHTVMSLRF